MFFTQISSLVLIWTKTKINFCPGSFVLTGLVEAAVIPYLGLSVQDLSLDEKAEFLLVAQGYAYHIINLPVAACLQYFKLCLPNLNLVFMLKFEQWWHVFCVYVQSSNYCSFIWLEPKYLFYLQFWVYFLDSEVCKGLIGSVLVWLVLQLQQYLGFYIQLPVLSNRCLKIFIAMVLVLSNLLIPFLFFWSKAHVYISSFCLKLVNIINKAVRKTTSGTISFSLVSIR